MLIFVDNISNYEQKCIYNVYYNTDDNENAVKLS